MTSQPRWVDGQRLAELVSPEQARISIDDALSAGLDPASDPARAMVPAGTGHLLLMPSSTAATVGVKVASVAPDNPARGKERIQALYILMDAETLTPSTLLDGTALTSLRTPAVSAVAADHLASPDARRLLVFGTGPQAAGHIDALCRVRPIDEVRVVGRHRSKVEELCQRLHDGGRTVRPGSTGDVATSDIIACATSAAEPLFDGALVNPESCVIAIGSHEPNRRELDASLLARSQVVVEDVATALREAGDVVLAAEEGHFDAAELVPLAALVTGRVAPAPGRPRVFKGTGMPWQDVVVAAQASRALAASVDAPT